MYTIYTNNPECPYCIQARNLLLSKDEHFAYKVVTKEYIQNLVPEALTVPQILYEVGEFAEPVVIGGYDNLLTWFHEGLANVRTAEPIKKIRTIFNPENTGYKTGLEPLFNGDQCGFTNSITQQYPIIDEIYEKMIAQIWNPTEVDLTQDRQDMLLASPALIDFSIQNIMFQTLADSAASRAITSVLMEHVSNTDLEAGYNCIGLFESIHARTYLHIIKQTLPDPVKALEDAYSNEAILKRAIPVVKHFDALANMSRSANKEERDEKVYMAVFALYLLESIIFPASFACTFAVAETGILQGISQDVSLILRDESLHSLMGQAIFNIEQKRIPQVFASIRQLMQELYNEVMESERVWIEYLFSNGRQVVGLTPNLMDEYLIYLSGPVLDTLDLAAPKRIEKNPLPYMESYIDTTKIQVANQELQNGTYLLNAILAPMDMDKTLRDLKEKYYESNIRD